MSASRPVAVAGAAMAAAVVVAGWVVLDKRSDEGFDEVPTCVAEEAGGPVPEGAVVAVYHSPELAVTERAQLLAVAEDHPGQVVVIPARDVPAPVVAVAEDASLTCREAEPEALREFVAERLD